MGNFWDNDPIVPQSSRPTFVPIGAPNPKFAPEVATAQGEAARQPALTSKAGSDAAQAAVAARYAAPLAAAKLRDTQSAATEAAAKGQAQADQHQLMAQAVHDQRRSDINVIASIDRALRDSSYPAATGTLGVIAQHVLPSFGDYAPNATYLANDLQTIGTNNALKNILDQRAQSPTGSTGMRVTQQEFNAFQNAYGSLSKNQSGAELRQNLQIMRDLWRASILRKAGIDPGKSNLLRAPLVGGGSGSAPAAQPKAAPSNVIDWNDL